MILNNILEAIGNTPIVKLNKVLNNNNEIVFATNNLNKLNLNKYLKS